MSSSSRNPPQASNSGVTINGIDDSTNRGEISKHLEKKNEVLMDVYKSTPAAVTSGGIDGSTNAGEILKHLEKENEVIMEVYKSMTQELQKLQVEEEMLMRKFYQIMSALGLTEKQHVGSKM